MIDVTSALDNGAYNASQLSVTLKSLRYLEGKLQQNLDRDLCCESSRWWIGLVYNDNCVSTLVCSNTRIAQIMDDIEDEFELPVFYQHLELKDAKDPNFTQSLSPARTLEFYNADEHHYIRVNKAL